VVFEMKKNRKNITRRSPELSKKRKRRHRIRNSLKRRNSDRLMRDKK
jgi:hypothetical protein